MCLKIKSLKNVYLESFILSIELFGTIVFFWNNIINSETYFVRKFRKPLILTDEILNNFWANVIPKKTLFMIICLNITVPTTNWLNFITYLCFSTKILIQINICTTFLRATIRRYVRTKLSYMYRWTNTFCWKIKIKIDQIDLNVKTWKTFATVLIWNYIF